MAKQIWAAEIFFKNLPEEIKQRLFDVHRQTKPVFGNKRRGFEEVFILTTDSQFVVYGVGDTMDPLLNFFLQDPALYEHVHFYKNTEASLNHLFATASGLCSDLKSSSKVIGDIQSAHYASLYSGGIGLTLDNVVRQALRVSKKVREATGIDRLTEILVGSGMDIVFNQLDNASELSYLVIGTGEIARSALEFFYHEGFRNVVLAADKSNAAQMLSTQYQVKSIELEQLPTFFNLADVVISEDAHALHQRNKGFLENLQYGQKKVFLDFGTPSLFHEELRKFPFVALYTIDDINSSPVASANIFHSLEEAWKMVETEVTLALHSLDELQYAPALNACWSKIVQRGEQEISLLQPEARSSIKNLELIQSYNQLLMRRRDELTLPSLWTANNKLVTPDISLLEPHHLRKLSHSFSRHLN